MPENPTFPYSGASRSSLGTKGRVITASATDLDPPAKAVSLLTGGNITVIPLYNADAAPIVYVGLPAGFLVPYVVRRVTALSGGATAATVDD